MPTPMISSQWSEFLTPVVRKEWYAAMGAAPASPSFQFYSIQSSSASVEYSQGVGGLGLVPVYNSSDAEGNPASIQYDSFAPLFQTAFVPVEYAKGIAIERKLWDFDQKGLIRRQVQSFGDAFGVTRAVHASSVFNNAFSATHVGGDAKALCADDHPVNKVSSSTYDNKGVTAFSYASVIAAIKAGHSMLDDRLNPRPVMYDTVLIPIGLQDTAVEELESLLKPGTADNNKSFLSSRGLQVVIDPYLTDQNNWFLIDSALAKQHLLWYNSALPEINPDPASNFNLVFRYAGYMRYMFGWDDSRFVYGSEVA